MTDAPSSYMYPAEPGSPNEYVPAGLSITFLLLCESFEAIGHRPNSFLACSLFDDGVRGCLLHSSVL